MLKYVKKRKRTIYVTQIKATDVLYEKMHSYNTEARIILNYLIELVKSQNKNSPALKSLYQNMTKLDDVVIDCAHKLAPYQTPKLESIEVRSKVEHKFVLRAPSKIASLEEWTKATGAEKLNSDQINPKAKEMAPIAPSIHDYADMDGDAENDLDEIKTYRSIN